MFSGKDTKAMARDGSFRVRVPSCRGVRRRRIVSLGAVPAALTGPLREPILRTWRPLRSRPARDVSVQPVQDTDLACGRGALHCGPDATAAGDMVRVRPPDRHDEERNLLGRSLVVEPPAARTMKRKFMAVMVHREANTPMSSGQSECC